MKQDFKDTSYPNHTEMLSRGEAIKKIGGYAALTALGTFMILNPQKAQAQSIPELVRWWFCPAADEPLPTCCPDCYDGVNTHVSECFGSHRFKRKLTQGLHVQTTISRAW